MGRKTVSDLLTGLAVVFTALLLVAAVLSWRASFVSPEAGNFWASIGLLMPVILLLNLAALVWWLLLRRWGVALMPRRGAGAQPGLRVGHDPAARFRRRRAP